MNILEGILGILLIVSAVIIFYMSLLANSKKRDKAEVNALEQYKPLEPKR